MRLIGFSTGALAFGDFRRGLELLRETDARAVELSALREHELPPLMQALPELPLDQFAYVSVHAPSRLASLSEKAVAEMLQPCIDRGFHVVLHPDAIQDPACWRAFGPLLCIENMDKRKQTGRTVSELRRFFADLPDASLCLDLAHARQVDTTLAVARFILAEFGGERVAQVHLSELDAHSHHAPLSMGAVQRDPDDVALGATCPRDPGVRRFGRRDHEGARSRPLVLRRGSPGNALRGSDPARPGKDCLTRAGRHASLFVSSGDGFEDWRSKRTCSSHKGQGRASMPPARGPHLDPGAQCHGVAGGLGLFPGATVRSPGGPPVPWIDRSFPSLAACDTYAGHGAR